MPGLHRYDPSKVINGKQFGIQVPGPVVSDLNGELAFKYFKDPAHTVNGHSLVLKLDYGTRTFLFGGDLNIPAEEHLLAHYKDENPFDLDLAKSCHHGASEFTLEYTGR